MLNNLINSIISNLTSSIISKEEIALLTEGLLFSVSTNSNDGSKSDLVIVDGSERIDTWIGQNDTAINVTQTVDLDKPIYTTNAINTFPALNHDGLNRFLENTTPLNIAGNVTIFVVAQTNTLAGLPHLFTDAGGAGGGFGFSLRSGGRYTFTTFNVKDYCSTAIQWQVGVSQIAAAVFDSNFDVSFYKNGSFIEKVTGVAPMLSTTGSIQTGALNSTFAWDGFIGQILVYGRALSASEIAQVFSFLSPRWNIPLT